MEQALTLQGIAVVGTGFLGSRLMGVLQSRGLSPVGVDPAAPADFPCSAAELPADLAPQAFRTVFCCMATHGGDAAAYRSCYLGTVQALRRRFPEALLVFCSSTSVYRPANGGLVAENAPTRSDSERVEVLLRAEGEVLAAGGIVARLSPLYGEGRCELLRRHLAGESRLPGPAARMLHYLHRDDAAEALLRLAECGQRRTIYNVCGEHLPHAEAYRLLETSTGRPAAPDCAPPGRRGASDLAPDCSRLRALGWEPVHRLQDFFRDNAR